jgi:metal-sulfur cluster biosynthetic enzyme
MTVDHATLTEEQVRDALREVRDPEVGLNVVELGLVYGIAIEALHVQVRMTMTSAACPLSDRIVQEAREAIRCIAPPGTEVAIELVWDPPWSPALMSESARNFFGWQGR